MFGLPAPLVEAKPFVGAVGTPAEGSGTSVSVSPPAAHRPGDLLVYGISTEVGFATEASGYTDPQGSSGNGVGAASARVNALLKTAGVSEGAVSGGLGSSHVLEQVLALRDVDATPNAMGKAGGSGATVNFPTITTTVDGCLILLVAAHTLASPISAWAGANVGNGISSIAEIANNVTLVDDDGGLAFAIAYQEKAGATGTFTATLASSSNWGGHIYAFKLAGT
ncbi:MAG: hypothetical protein M9955_17325 [Rhizobiaceae bacterium]|nr:hypothetical protein [Rhizobiaceae bacterium]